MQVEGMAKANNEPKVQLSAAVIFLVALNLRPAIIAVGPLLSQIGVSFGWGESLLGLLGSLPLLAFAALSFLVRYITDRFDTDKVMLAALLLIASGCIVRSACGATGIWIGTVIVGGSIAVGNVLAPAIVKRDYPTHISMATGAYSAFVTTGSALAGLSAAALAEALGGWQEALLFWAAPALVAALLWLLRMQAQAKSKCAPGNECALECEHAPEAEGANNRNAGRTFAGQVNTATSASGKTATIAAADAALQGRSAAKTALDGSTETTATPGAVRATATEAIAQQNAATSIPLRKRPSTWLVTLFMGLQSAAFYTFSNWLPSFSVAAGYTPTEAGLQLFLFQIIGTFAGLAIPRFMYVRGNQTTAGLIASTALLIAALGWLFLPQASLLWSIVGGIGQGSSLVVALTLISLRGTTHEETVALSGIAQSVGYLLAACGPVAFGALLEATGTFTCPLGLMAVLALCQCLLCFAVGKDPAQQNNAR